ncbi:MAG: arginase family hydrolase, arginase/agmainase/formiminoglutamate hydrolase [Bacteroidetes bacterium]|nr:arginase family hydrolase, arginase/agmainase/formiminoglutamate hydrolase [Bacteroidota bacterium]
MDFSIYFDPIKIDEFTFYGEDNVEKLGHTFLINSLERGFPSLDGANIAIIGVGEERNAVNNSGCGLAPNQIRKYLYNLFPHRQRARVLDMGNLKLGNSVEDTYHVLAEVIAELLKNRIIPIILGGSNEICYANYRGYENIGQIINAFAIDSGIDMGHKPEIFNSKSYLMSMVCREPNYLFNYTQIGYQTYFVDPDTSDLMESLYFESYRLGKIQENLDNAEPLIRNADMVSVDISAVRQSDAPANGNASPHGFYGEELCKLVRYAGMSDKCSSIGFYELNPRYDRDGQTSHMVAHAIWYFIDGYLWRKQDFPYKEKDSYRKFHVAIHNNSHIIVFYKSKKSDRWWMEVPCTSDKLIKYERHYLVPCSYDDYKTALNDEIPDRWLMAYNKMTI